MSDEAVLFKINGKIYDYSELKAIASYYMNLYGQDELVDDFAHYIIEIYARGWRQTHAQMAIDFLRRTRGDMRFAKGQTKLKEFSVSGDILEATCSSFAPMWEQVGSVFNDYCGLFSKGEESAIFALYFLMDWTELEIGKIFQWSETASSQKVTKIKNKLREHLKDLSCLRIKKF